ncbi:MAG: bacteriohemerythrin [Magnetovibrio sp.]|nr:bacteriohemerythrin [Magnetovibrio sp.]
MKFNISGRLFAGFGAVGLVLMLAISTTYFKVSDINVHTIRVQDLRTPTSDASTDITKNIYASLAALRGYMLTGKAAFKTQRADVWASIDENINNMDVLSVAWTNPANVENLRVFKGILNEFRNAQNRVEDIAKTPQEQPATLMLVTKAAPLALIMVSNITKMIDLELQGKGGTQGDRMQILGMMADTRGTLGLGLANIRAYLLTGDEKFAQKFDKLWAKNTKRFGDLSAQASTLSIPQQLAFKSFSAKRKDFSGLPSKMFAIRGSKKWNMANYTLVTEAAPRAGKLLNMLLGTKDASGVRQGGMRNNQKVLLDKDLTNVNESVDNLLLTEEFFLVIGLALSAGIAFIIGRSISVPVKTMTGAMNKLSDGNLEVDIPGQNRSDEVGGMASSVQVFKENMIRARALEREQEARQKQKDNQQAQTNRGINSFQLTVLAVMEELKKSDKFMTDTSSKLMAGAQDSNEQATTVAAAAEEASVNVQAVASAAEELSASVQEISRQSSESTQIITEAVTETESTINNIKELENSVLKINDVVSLITDIADQTNLLALNATIEAARAGDAGKGFAVVASEVKNLANQTAKATEDISSQINEVQRSTEVSVNSISRISHVINRVNDVSASIQVAMEQQQVATSEIAKNVEQAATGTADVSSAISLVSAASTASISLAQNIQESSDNLSEQTVNLNTDVAQFLSKVRAATQGDAEDLIAWNDDISVGNTTIDGEHKNLISIINELYRGIISEDDISTHDHICLELKKYTDFHFGHEEELMADHGYKDLEAHALQHKGFIKRQNTLLDNYRTGKPESSEKLLNFLGSWWTSHIKLSDVKLADSIRGEGS